MKTCAKCGKTISSGLVVCSEKCLNMNGATSLKKLVYICSPLQGDIPGNIKKAISYCKFAMESGVIPLAPHTIFTQFLDDNNPVERHQGMSMGLELLTHCDEIWVFICGPISMGMIQEINKAEYLKIPVFFHTEFCDRITEKG